MNSDDLHDKLEPLRAHDVTLAERIPQGSALQLEPVPAAPPQPPPPGVSIRSTSPALSWIVHLSGRRSARLVAAGQQPVLPHRPGLAAGEAPRLRHPPLGDERHRHVLEHLEVALDALAARRRARAAALPAQPVAQHPHRERPLERLDRACSSCWSSRCGRRSCPARPGPAALPAADGLVVHPAGRRR